MSFDLIVVGGGHNGLVCAAYAADAGLKVAVVERHDRVGGAAITEEFHPGFRNSAASYTVSLLDPGIGRDLGLRRHGLEIRTRPLDNFVPALEGPGLKLPSGRKERYAELAGFSPRDADAYERFAAELDRVIGLVRPLLARAPVDPLAGPREVARTLALAGRSLAHGPRAIRSAIDLFRRSAGHWLDSCFETDLLKGALGFDSIVGHFASPYTKGSAYLLLHHAFGEVDGRRGAWGHAVGGMGAISDALARAAIERGVEIRTGEPVEQISREAAGFSVVTANGVIESRAVAGAVHPQHLFLELLRGADLPTGFRQRIESWHSESASFRMNVALSELPDFRCLPGTAASAHHGAGILIAPSLSYLDRAHQDALGTGMSAEPVIELVIPSVIDDTLAPPGRHVASLFCQHFRYDLPDGQSWRAARDLAVTRILDTVDEYAPNFKRSILGASALSPIDLERRFGLVGGDIFHGAMTRDQLYHRRPATRYARYRSPVPDLYLCGSGAHPGGGVSGLPGRNAARAILEDAGAATRRR
ncbi:MAG: NAD(P)/FAD-dependent oxidoreductase [Gammaproteobacteria bacterium]|jgi:phytoene dehydrogenase-like protein